MTSLIKFLESLATPTGMIVLAVLWAIFCLWFLWNGFATKKINWKSDVALSKGETLHLPENVTVELKSDEPFKLESPTLTINSKHIDGPISHDPGSEIWAGVINAGDYKVKRGSFDIYFGANPKASVTPSLRYRIVTVISSLILFVFPAMLYFMVLVGSHQVK